MLTVSSNEHSESVHPIGRRSKVLLVCPRNVATFSRQDLHLLQREFDASIFPFKGISSLGPLRRAMNGSDAVLIWFAGRHSGPTVWLARRREIPVITIVGGYEAAWIPELDYGMRPHSLRERIVRWVLENSSRVLVVSKATEHGVARVTDRVKEKTFLVHNAVDTSLFRPADIASRTGVLCVGMIGKRTLTLKGWQLFFETARQMSQVPFVAVGPAIDSEARKLISQAPPNLTWLGPRYGNELIGQYQRASLYFQGSVHESFSLSLAESMACGCIPVVSRNGALPEVASDVGCYLDDLTVSSAVRAINAALGAPPERRIQARQRIVDHFDIERRRRALCELVHETIRRPKT